MYVLTNFAHEHAFRKSHLGLVFRAARIKLSAFAFMDGNKVKIVFQLLTAVLHCFFCRIKCKPLVFQLQYLQIFHV